MEIGQFWYLLYLNFGRFQEYLTGVLVDLPHEHRYPEPLAACLARQQGTPPLRQQPARAVVLGLRVGQETGPEEHRVFAIFLAQRVHTFVEMRQPLQPDDFTKEVELAVICL